MDHHVMRRIEIAAEIAPRLPGNWESVPLSRNGEPYGCNLKRKDGLTLRLLRSSESERVRADVCIQDGLPNDHPYAKAASSLYISTKMPEITFSLALSTKRLAADIARRLIGEAEAYRAEVRTAANEQLEYLHAKAKRLGVFSTVTGCQIMDRPLRDWLIYEHTEGFGLKVASGRSLDVTLEVTDLDDVRRVAELAASLLKKAKGD